MPNITTPVYTGNAAGNALASAALAASSNVTFNLDYSALLEGQLHIKNTPGGAVSGTRGLRVDVYRRYGSAPTVAQSPYQSYTLPSATAATAESVDLFLPPGKYQVKLTNIDAAQAVTVEATSDTIDSLSTA